VEGRGSTFTVTLPAEVPTDDHDRAADVVELGQVH
jgi:hypothetical protein